VFATRTVDTIYSTALFVTPHGDGRASRFNPVTEKQIGARIDDRRNDNGSFSGLFVIADRLTKSEIRASASLSTPEPMMMMRATV
jgi:hypothetical protein